MNTIVVDENTKFITHEELKHLHEIIGWLDSLTNVNVVVGNSVEEYDNRLSEALQELVKLNNRRNELLNILLA